MSGPIVVKIGGAAGVDPTFLLDEAAGLGPLLVVHGFSHDATELGRRLGRPPRFVTSPSGHRSRFTDAQTLDVVHMAAMRYNDRLVEGLQRRGLTAIGLRAGDVGVVARWKAALRDVAQDGRVVLLRGDRSGRIERVRPAALEAVLGAGATPVCAPLARTADGALASVDGDRCAAAIAGALGASALVILTGPPGVLADAEDPASRLPRLHLSTHDEAATFIQGPMKRKVLATKEALHGGVARAFIGAAGRKAPVASAMAGSGTEVTL